MSKKILNDALTSKKCLFLINDLLRRYKETDDVDEQASLNKRLNLYRSVYYELKRTEDD